MTRTAGLVALVFWLSACAADADRSAGSSAIGSNAGPSGTGGRSPNATGGVPAFGNAAGASGGPSGGAGPAACDASACAAEPPPHVADDDGFSVAEGDCDDFNASVNPGAFDVPGNGIDEDCQGGDATSASCDDALDIASAEPLDAARAIELCPVVESSGRGWGVISARWTTPDGLGTPADGILHGILPGFGKGFAPRAGAKLLAISSGVARAPDQAGFVAGCSAQAMASSKGLPEGFDGRSTSCPPDTEVTTVVDAVALELQLRVPTNASALSFDSAFFTSEYPVYICTPFNDYFQVLVLPKRKGGSTDGNVVFDLDGNAVSVNNSLLRACVPGTHGDKMFECPLGLEPLKGTGYEDCGWEDSGMPGVFGGVFGGGTSVDAGKDPDVFGASTGWLSTELAVKGGETITIRITIWDSGDSALDSLAVIDNVRFRLLDAPPPPETPLTMPVGPD